MSDRGSMIQICMCTRQFRTQMDICQKLCSGGANRNSEPDYDSLSFILILILYEYSDISHVYTVLLAISSLSNMLYCYIASRYPIVGIY